MLMKKVQKQYKCFIDFSLFSLAGRYTNDSTKTNSHVTFTFTLRYKIAIHTHRTIPEYHCIRIYSDSQYVYSICDKYIDDFDSYCLSSLWDNIVRIRLVKFCVHFEWIT